MPRRLAIVCAALLASCSAAAERGSPPVAGEPDASAAAAGPADVELLAVADLPRTATTRALSATWFDDASGVLHALQDTQSNIVPLVPSNDYRSWKPGAPVTLTGRPGAAWDGEGLARIGDEFFVVTVETAPLIERFDREGTYIGAVELPARFARQAAGNKGLESLAVSPSGAFLFTANEAALTTDGDVATTSRGTLVRILRRELATDEDEERAYLTEPLGAGGTRGDMGVSDIAAVSDDRLLILERGFQPDYGSTVRIFEVDLGSAPDVASIASLDASTPTLAKRLVVDLASLTADGVTHPGVQPNPILDNYEALSLGPALPDGRRVLFVTSDDNESSDQVARILVLALRTP